MTEPDPEVGRFIDTVCALGALQITLAGGEAGSAFMLIAAAVLEAAIDHPEWAQAWRAKLLATGMPKTNSNAFVAALPISSWGAP